MTGRDWLYLTNPMSGNWKSTASQLYQCSNIKIEQNHSQYVHMSIRMKIHYCRVNKISTWTWDKFPSITALGHYPALIHKYNLLQQLIFMSALSLYVCTDLWWRHCFVYFSVAIETINHFIFVFHHLLIYRSMLPSQ